MFLFLAFIKIYGWIDLILRQNMSNEPLTTPENTNLGNNLRYEYEIIFSFAELLEDLVLEINVDHQKNLWSTYLYIRNVPSLARTSLTTLSRKLPVVFSSPSFLIFLSIKALLFIFLQAFLVIIYLLTGFLKII